MTLTAHSVLLSYVDSVQRAAVRLVSASAAGQTHSAAFAAEDVAEAALNILALLDAADIKPGVSPKLAARLRCAAEHLDGRADTERPTAEVANG
jgi:hypothetical protein